MSLPSSTELQEVIDSIVNARERLASLVDLGTKSTARHTIAKASAELTSARFSLLGLMKEVKDLEARRLKD